MDWKAMRAASASPPKYLTQEEVERFLSVIDRYRDYALFNLMYRFGLRASEPGLLLVEDLDLERGRIFITRRKGSQSNTYLLDPDIKNILRTYLMQRRENSPYLFPSRERKPISRHMIGILYHKYYDNAGLTDRRKRHPHCLRHSIAVHCVDANSDIMQIKHLLGHKNIESTLIYADISENKQMAEMLKLRRSPWIVKPQKFAGNNANKKLSKKIKNGAKGAEEPGELGEQ